MRNMTTSTTSLLWIIWVHVTRSAERMRKLKFKGKGAERSPVSDGRSAGLFVDVIFIVKLQVDQLLFASCVVLVGSWHAWYPTGLTHDRNTMTQHRFTEWKPLRPSCQGSCVRTTSYCTIYMRSNLDIEPYPSGLMLLSSAVKHLMWSSRSVRNPSWKCEPWITGQWVGSTDGSSNVCDLTSIHSGCTIHDPDAGCDDCWSTHYSTSDEWILRYVVPGSHR